MTNARFNRPIQPILYIVAVFVLICLGGVPMSVNASDGLFQNPVIDINFPDPFVMKVDDTYYAYSTNSNSRNLPVATSTDLVNWQMGRDGMPALAKWINLSRPDVWAPEIIRVEDEYLLYYTARNKETGVQCIGLAISDSPEGPFRDRSESPLICQLEEGGSIDANPFRDADGKLYLYWKNDGNDRRMKTYIYAQQLSADGRELIGEPVRLVENNQPWHGPLVEAPTMWLRDGRYYLFYSANFFASDAYAVGYAVCETPLGPCVDAEENPILATDRTAEPLVIGPGHQTVFEDEAGETWMIYHAWQVTRNGDLTSTRQVWIDRVVWVDDRPVVQGATREPQPMPITQKTDS
jgi:beta-xylosidase